MLRLPCYPGPELRVNAGPWLVHYTAWELEARLADQPAVLPVCSLGTPAEELTRLAPLVLPPLYHEALAGGLKEPLLARVRECFPYYLGTRKRASFEGRFEIVELPPRHWQPPRQPRVLAFSVDTAVEQHGPHLPLATDTIQSYAVLERLAGELAGVCVGPAADYGHLTWGLPYGLSIDLTPPLLARYMAGFANALIVWAAPEALYVVDVHGSLAHRQAIEEGLAASRAARWKFRWLHEPLVAWAAEQGDQHAGGVETALVEHINPALVDARYWPARVDELAAGEMPLALAGELSSNLDKFIRHAETQPWNGIVGRVRNYFNLDAAVLMQRMLDVARRDLAELLA